MAHCGRFDVVSILGISFFLFMFHFWLSLSCVSLSLSLSLSLSFSLAAFATWRCECHGRMDCKDGNSWIALIRRWRRRWLMSSFHVWLVTCWRNYLGNELSSIPSYILVFSLYMVIVITCYLFFKLIYFCITFTLLGILCHECGSSSMAN